MKQKIEGAIKKRKVIMAIMEIILIIACSIFIWIMTIPKDKFLASTYSYSKVEKYEINGDYLTRVMPQTDYETFIKIAQNTIKDTVSQDFSIKIYKNKEKTQEVTSGYIATGMVAVVNYKDMVTNENVAESKNKSEENVVDENNENSMNTENATDSNSTNIANENEKENLSDENDKETGDNQEVSKDLEYTISVIGDLTGNGDMNVTELTRIVRGVVKLKNWDFKDEEKLTVDLNGDGQIDVTDVECCINYIVFGEFEVVKKDVASPSIEVKGDKDATNEYYTSDVVVNIIENEPKENIRETRTSVEMALSDTEETKIVETAENTFKLSKNGTYTITSQTFNKDGNKSDIVTKTIKINKDQKTDTAYKVEHYKEKLDGSYELAETENLTGTTGEKVTAKAKTPEEYKGFTEDASNKDRIAEGTIAGDGSLTLKLYYTRNQYTLTLNKDENVENVTGAGTYKYGATVSINATLKEEAGYDIRWNKWVSANTEIISDKEEQNATIEMPAGEVTLTATTTKEAKADTAYKVEHYKEKLDGSYELAETENLKGTTGEKVTAKAKTPEEYKGFTEDTSNKDRIAEGTIAGDGSLTLKLYYTRNTYTIKFEDYNGSILGEEKEYRYGQTIEVPEDPTRPEDETYTYTFAGWDKEITEANENRVYVATYTATYREYVVTFKQDNGNEINSRNYHYGDTIIVPENPEKESTIEHAYEFIGWKLIKEGTAEDNIIEDTSNLTVTGNAEYIATYREEDIRYNFIYYNDDGEEVVARIDGYTFGNKLEIPTSATKEPTDTIKYTFKSWDMIGMEDISKTEKNVKFKATYKEEYFVARLEETDTLEGKSYMTLQEAIDAAGEEARTVKLLRDTEESVLVDDVQNITIDLNGKTVTGSKTGIKAYAVKNYGILEIIDTTEEKNGKIQESARGKTGYGIYNKDGQLTIRSGMIVTDTDIESGNTYAIYNQSEAPLIIAGGTTMAEARGISSSSYGIYNLSGKEIQVIGGTVLGNAGAESSKGYGIYNATDGNINVSGGKVKGSTSLASAVSYGIYNAVSENVAISGGVVEVKSNSGVAYGVYNEQGKVTQAGGTVDIAASTGYGFYNKKGTIDIKGGTIELNGLTMYGVYNETAGTANVLEGEINLLGTSAYGIYNRGNINITGGNIVSKTEDSGYGIYNISVIDSNISNVTISKTDYGIYNSQGNLTVKNVNITAKCGIKMQASDYKVAIESANIVGKTYGINCTYGTVEIGIKDGKINETQPNIYGETNAIYNDLISTGKVKYYDGILIGNMVIYGGINEIEDNTQIVVSTNSDNKEVAKLENVVAEESVVKVGDTTYPTLAEAVDAVKKEANEQSLIEAISDFTISKAVEIPEGTNIKIDLAGHEVITYGKGGITNNGSLEIVDTSSAKNAEFISKIGIGITNKGALVINGGSISSNVYGIYNYGSGSIVINDGVVTGKSDGMYNGGGQNAKITINGGTINGTDNYGIYNYNSSNTEIIVNNGEICGKYSGMYNESRSSSTVFSVAGGTIKGIINYGIHMYYGTLNVTGGVITGKNKGIYVDYGKVSMTDGTISNGIYNYGGTINIEGGKVEGTDGISAGTSATVVIGKKDNNVNVNNPIIIGKNYGINISSAKIYDGKILGKTDAISGSINEIEEGKKIQVENTTYNDEEYKVANLVDNDIYEDPIVRVGNNEYKTWKEIKKAISNVATNVTETTKVTILNDFYMPEELEIKNGQKITLDLNGKTVTTMSKIVNRGTLEIVDNTEEADGKILNTNSMGVQNFSNMTITKGTIEAKSYGICNDSGDLTIGIEDNNVTNMPMIKSESYGVYKYNGSIVMFDGTIFGKTSPDSMIDRTEEEYKVHSYQEGEYYKTVIVELSPMAKIGDIETSLIEAIELAKKGDTIEILRNIEVKNETIVIPENKDITIDLKEYKISMKSSATNLNAILENRGTLNLIGKGSSGICNNTNIGTTIINNGTLDLLGGSIYSDYGTVVENNGIFNLKNGYIDYGSGSYSSRYYLVRNTAEFNMLGGSIDTSWHKSGIKNEKGATFTMKAGTIYADECGIYNDSDNEINLLGGTIKRDYTATSTSYAIYNNTNANIKIEGLTIYASYTYGIYNKLNGNITISNKTNINIMSSDYSYGIYNNGTGNINISGESIISAKNGKVAYGVYNNGSGNLTIEQSTVSANGSNQAYGIMNANEGTVVITNGNMNVESNSGYAYGINNGVLGTVTLERANIIVNTTEGKAYGINNESKNPLIIKEGVIGVGGTQSTGIYSSTSNIVLGNRDENITTEVPVIKADNIGVYINEVGAKFNFYDGQIIGKIPFNTGANTIDGYKIIQYYDKEESAEVAIPVETDYYVLTYAINGQEKYDSLVLKAGTKITNDILPNIEEGYDFSGWEGLPEVMPSEDVTVYAILVPKTYTITYYVDGEEYARQENIEYKSTITPIEVPQKEGNEFSGWEGLPEVMPAEDIEVRGVFTYFATFYNEDKTEVIKQVPFTINDTSIEEPKIVEQEGYIRYWDEYKLEAKNIEIPLISIKKSTVVNETQRKSYNNIESAIAEAKTDGTKDELYLFEDINSETTLIIPENTNIEINLNGHKIINNNTYCAINNYGTLTIKNTSEELSSIEISKEGTNVYGIYNRKNVTVDNVNIKVTSEETYEGIGIYNEANTITTLGIKDEIASKTMPKIVATTFAISNESGIFNFYDGYLIADRAINGKITETEIGHDKNIEIIDERENCYLEQIANGTKLQAIDGNGITWNFTVSNKRAINVYYESGDLLENLVIPSTLKGCPVTSLYNEYRKNIFEKSTNNAIKKIIIPDSVTNIGTSAFYNCEALTSIKIPDSVTSIESYAFLDCYKLSDLSIGNKVKSIGYEAFQNCTSLTSITIPDSVTNIGDYAFFGCTALTSVTIPVSVTSIGSSTFSGCTALTSITIPASVTSIGNSAFYGCTALTNVTIPASVTSIGNEVFESCDSLERIDVDKNNMKYSSKDGILFDKYKLTIIKYPSNKRDITEYAIPKTVNNISKKAFYKCTALINVTIPDSVTSIGSYAFSGCTSLTNMTIPDSVTSIGSYAFSGCTSLTNIVIPNNVTSIESATFSECTSLTNMTIPDSVTSIGSYAFSQCSSLTAVSIPNGVETLGDYTFSECSNLIRIQIGKGIIKMPDNVLNNCNKLERIEVDENNTSYSSFDGVLFDKEKLSLIRYPSNKSDISNYEIPSMVEAIKNGAFSNCSTLTNVTIGNSVTSIGDYAFSNCSALTSVKIPDSVVTIGYDAFSNCSVLTNVTIGNSVTSIGNYAFYNCSALTSVIIGNSVTSIGNYAFYNCSALTSVKIPDSVVTIEYNAFYNCSALTNVTIGNGVTSIGNSAFYDCGNIVDIYIKKIQSEVTFGSYWKSSGYVHYSDCTHNLTNNIQSETLLITQTEYSDSPENGKISCRGTYQFKLVNESGEVVKDKLIKIKEQERESPSSNRIIWIAPDQEGIYTIENIIRNVSIEEIGELSNGKVVQATDSNGITWNYTYQNGKAKNIYYEQGNITSDIELPSELDGHTVISCKDNMFSNVATSRTVKEITIPESIESINDSAFSRCDNLESINVNENNNYYSSLSGILYDKDQTKIKIIPRAIKEAIIPNSVTSIGYNAFYNCSKLTSVTIPEGVTTIGDYTFYNCSQLTNIEIPNSVTSMGYGVFQDCTSLTNVTIGSGVTNILNNIFNGCNKLESINVSEENKTYSGVDGILCNKEQTEIICIPIAIKEVNIPDTIIEIENGMFDSCRSLTSVTIGRGVADIGNIAFSKCSKLENINVSEKNANYSSVGGILYNKQRTEMIMVPRATKEVDVPNTVTKIKNYAFYNCDNLKMITIGDRVTDIEIEEVSFYNCSELKSINVSNNNTAYSSIDGILYNKEQTRLVKVPRAVEKVLMPGTIETIGNYAYNDCTNLSDIVIRNGVKTIESYAFNNCSRLKNIIIPNSVIRIEGCAFNNCGNLNNVIIGNGVTSIGNEAFSNCRNLEDITVSEENNTYSSVNGVLYDKDQTSIIIIPDKNKGEIIIPKGMFSIETEHDYSNNISRTYVKTIQGATSLTLTFDSNCFLEDNYDYVIISDKNGTDIYNSKGQGNKALANKEITVEGDTVKIHFYTDRSNVYWGFKCLVKASNTK